MRNPFKPGDRVVCIERPRPYTYGCAVGAKATVSRVGGTLIYTKEDICNDWGVPTPAHACYHYSFFALAKSTISFKQLKEY